MVASGVVYACSHRTDQLAYKVSIGNALAHRVATFRAPVDVALASLYSSYTCPRITMVPRQNGPAGGGGKGSRISCLP